MRNVSKARSSFLPERRMNLDKGTLGYAPEMAVLALDRARTHRTNTFSISPFVRLISPCDFFRVIKQLAIANK